MIVIARSGEQLLVEIFPGVSQIVDTAEKTVSRAIPTASAFAHGAWEVAEEPTVLPETLAEELITEQEARDLLTQFSGPNWTRREEIEEIPR